MPAYYDHYFVEPVLSYGRLDRLLHFVVMIAAESSKGGYAPLLPYRRKAGSLLPILQQAGWSVLHIPVKQKMVCLLKWSKKSKQKESNPICTEGIAIALLLYCQLSIPHSLPSDPTTEAERTLLSYCPIRPLPTALLNYKL